ncbi:AlpA Predicted transcriptional regulator [uncultured Caudovirales phage]|uniref:AlpA Predicted transcriptional regulator n=1 Tax=uncultured Caudovirales phage TaxID=2100421 RepID=A0A6J5RQV5_9CAUD|nr:AlpA Predicted transcriptional regulator [uncultured Caudovirales phage]CAB4169364.1 AlpA Predicted transcriptional regulator [uncultured Caudovirales phage]CAB4181381.1 AlpA Predicted transcriptional regulator [uncultured Caudovirales phage]CAB4190079.1 AlpA Predicted transcriptional regulator [uncultured Caudovirales phage]CAB4196068.1 AlpA Predicted transcriptional regulator [uncultured Caudovirales phage]
MNFNDFDSNDPHDIARLINALGTLNRSAFMRVREVTRVVGLSGSGIRTLIAKGDFPRPFKLGTRMVAWKTHEISDWIESRERVK